MPPQPYLQTERSRFASPSLLSRVNTAGPAGVWGLDFAAPALNVPPLMRLLDRYVLRELLLPLAYCLGFFLIVFVAFDLFKDIGDFQKARLTPLDVAEYYFNKIPEFLVASYILPIALLLALLYALTTLSRHNELTAMRAAAIPLWRISAPLFAVGFILSLVVFYLNEKLVPDGIDAAESVMRRHKSDQQKAADKVWRRNIFFLNPVANRTWRIGAYHMSGNAMIQPQIDARQPDGSVLQLNAERARWLNRRWVFTNVTLLEFAADTSVTPTISKTNQFVFPDLTETPRVIRSEIKLGGVGENLKSLRRTQLSSPEILDYLKLHPKMQAKQSASLRTLLHSRLASPWICLVVVFIAVPFGAVPGRRNVFVGVASSVFICFVYLITKDLSLAFGSGGFVPPWIAAWAPNLLFAATGLGLMWRVR
jgi:lipopolysaccharide export system permease protein